MPAVHLHCSHSATVPDHLFHELAPFERYHDRWKLCSVDTRGPDPYIDNDGRLIVAPKTYRDQDNVEHQAHTMFAHPEDLDIWSRTETWSNLVPELRKCAIFQYLLYCDPRLKKYYVDGYRLVGNVDLHRSASDSWWFRQ